ncbi:MAG: methyltransferase domain-containing protein [Candidatus Omnitrophica bacterium]|nr:methyltransferase domain-containing protein [Candidatus Omnitrophota bacterium]
MSEITSAKKGKSMKLNLGCGRYYMEGWINVDAPKNENCYDDLKADVYARIEDLKYPDNSVDEILMNAVFEHFPRHVAIMQLRAFYKWLKPDGGKLTITVPDFWGTVEMLKKSGSPKEQQFWFRHLYGPQDTIRLGIHYDAFDVEKLKWMFSIVGFNEFHYEIIKLWPSILFIGIKNRRIKSDADTERDIIDYMANYEAKDENGRLFGAWMDAMGLKAKKPKTPTFKTQEMHKK